MLLYFILVLIHNNCVFLSHHAEITFPFCEDKISLLNSKGGQVFAFMMRSIRTKINGMISTAMTGLNETKFSNGKFPKLKLRQYI